MLHPFSDRPTFRRIDLDLFAFGTGHALDPVSNARLRRFIERLPMADPHDKTVWGEYAHLHGEALAALNSTDEAASAIKERLYATSLTHGFLQGHIVYPSVRDNPDARRLVGAIILDRLHRLAEAVGVRRVQSREHGQTEIEVGDVDALFAAIEGEIGCDLTPPNQAGALFGLNLSRGILTDRHCDGIYAAWRALTLAKQTGVTDPLVCEIGGGSGHLAYYARKMGLSRLLVIDLGPVIVPQYMLLSAAFGPDSVSLDGPIADGIELIRAGVDGFGRVGDANVVINVDSMPEMSPEAARTYLTHVANRSLLLSINQESAMSNGPAGQNVVGDLAGVCGLKRLSRTPSWLRTGWVEEVFVGAANSWRA